MHNIDSNRKYKRCSIFHDQLTAILKNAELTGKNKNFHSYGLNEAFLNLFKETKAFTGLTIAFNSEVGLINSVIY